MNGVHIGTCPGEAASTAEMAAGVWNAIAAEVSAPLVTAAPVFPSAPLAEAWRVTGTPAVDACARYDIDPDALDPASV